MDHAFITPDAIEQVVQRFNTTHTPFTEHDVSRDLGVARIGLVSPSEAENAAAWSDELAFALTPPQHENPWNTYFGPMGSSTSKDRQRTTFFPDIVGTPVGAVDYWSQRARSLSHPLLKARYADLAWDMAQVIGQKKRDPEDARVAIDANLASIAVRDEPHDQFVAAIRALDLACLLSDTARVDAARAALLELHRAANKAGSHQWWFAIDRLIDDKKSGITDAERAELVADLEGLIVRYTDEAIPGWHDPNAARDAADRLIKHYEKQQRSSDIKRLR